MEEALKKLKNHITCGFLIPQLRRKDGDLTEWKGNAAFGCF